jgi:membrane protein
MLPEELDFLIGFYWLVTPVLTIVSLTSLYHISAPVRTPWKRDLPGAVLTLLIWFGGSFVIRWIIAMSVGGASIYGPLAAPIVVMIWLYVLAIAVLIGAALNAAVEKEWPVREIVVDEDDETVADPPESVRGDEPPPNRTPVENPLAPLGEPR